MAFATEAIFLPHAVSLAPTTFRHPSCPLSLSLIAICVVSTRPRRPCRARLLKDTDNMQMEHSTTAIIYKSYHNARDAMTVLNSPVKIVYAIGNRGFDKDYTFVLGASFGRPIRYERVSCG